MPPPNVSPPTPVVEMKPLGVASPKGWVAWSTSPQVQPPSTRTVRADGIDAYALHGREVDHQAIVAGTQARAVVPATPHGQRQLMLASKVDSSDHIGDIHAACDQRGCLLIMPL